MFSRLFRHRPDQYHNHGDLAHLLASYFHQDYLLVHGSEEGVLDNYVRSEDPSTVNKTIAEIERLAGKYEDELLAAYQRWFPYSFIVGDNDQQAREWFDWLSSGLRRRLAEESPPTVEWRLYA